MTATSWEYDSATHLLRSPLLLDSVLGDAISESLDDAARVIKWNRLVDLEPIVDMASM